MSQRKLRWLSWWNSRRALAARAAGRTRRGRTPAGSERDLHVAREEGQPLPAHPLGCRGLSAGGCSAGFLRLGGVPVSPGAPCPSDSCLHAGRPKNRLFGGGSCQAWAMAAEAHDTWRSRLTGSADRRGIPLGTIVVAVVVVILLLDLNAALILGLWVLRTIVVYVIIAFFFTLLMTPATRFLHRHGMSHGGATVLVFLLGAVALGGLVYLFTEPLVTAAVHFGQADPAPGGRGQEGPRAAGPARLPPAPAEVPLGGIGQAHHAAHQGAQAGHRVLGRRGGRLDHRRHRHHRRPHLLHHARGAAHVARLPRPVPPPHGGPAEPGDRRVHPLGHRLHARQRPDLRSSPGSSPG